MLPNQIATPPVDLVMSPHYNIVLAVSFGLLALALAWVLVDCRKTGRLLPLLILIGCAIASLEECLFDVFCNVWWAQYGVKPFYRILNISVPLWMLPAYGWFMGGGGYLMYRKLQAGITPRQLWLFYFSFWAANLALELPALWLGNIYTYYGPQPFQILGFPLWMAATNSLVPICLGFVFYSLDDTLRGPRALLAVAIAPMIVGAAEFTAAWPTWLALNAGVGYGVTRPAALVTFGLSFLVVYLVGLKFCTAASPQKERLARQVSQHSDAAIAGHGRTLPS
jgi:hypothetical protein